MKDTSKFKDISAVAVCVLHDECLATPNWAKSGPPRFTDGVWKMVELNHRFNTLLWDEEDQARRRDVDDALIAANKRAIDKCNQQRQDAIEKIDECLLDRLQDVEQIAGARQSSETAGSMIDRLSILSLKLFHMDVQCRRTDVDADHIQACRSKHAVLREQRADLQRCLDTLLTEAERGGAYFKVYRQFKMYNDPKLNPYLYKTGSPNS